MNVTFKRTGADKFLVMYTYEERPETECWKIYLCEGEKLSMDVNPVTVIHTFRPDSEEN